MDSTETQDKRPALFRSTVYQKHGAAAEGSVLLLNLPSLPRVACVAAILCTLLICLLYFGEYTRREKVSGVVLSGLGAMKVYAPTNGSIVRRFVQEGEVVREGQPLFLISTDRSTLSLGNTQEAISVELRRRKSSFETDLVRVEQLHRVEVKKLSDMVNSGESQQSQLGREIELAKTRVKNADAIYQRNRMLARDGFLSQASLVEKEQEFVAQQMQLESLVRQLENLKKETASVVSEIAEATHRKELDVSSRMRSIAEIDQQLADVDARREFVVTAQISGTVAGMAVDKGQVVSTSTMLLAILPPGDVHDVQLFVPSRAVGFVTPGTVVMLRFDSFPYQKFGQYRGVVRDISRTPLAPQEIQASLPAGEDYFRVWVKADEASVNAYGKKVALQNGMKLEADLLLDRRRIYEWAIEPILGFAERT